MVRRFARFDDYEGEIPQRTNGVAIAQEEGVATPYALFNIGERVQMFIEPGTKVYEGMIIGMNASSDDMVVNPCKAKKATNMRAAGSDDNIKLAPAQTPLHWKKPWNSSMMMNWWKSCRTISV